MEMTKKEYMREKLLEYKRLKGARKLALKLENKIADIRNKGYKLIVLGSRVKITLAK